MRILRAAIGCITQLLVLSAFCAPFQNGDFESRTSQTEILPIGDTSLTGCTVGGTESNIHWVDSGYTHLRHIIRFDAMSSGATQWIEQTFDTVPGQEYRAGLGANGHNQGGFAGV